MKRIFKKLYIILIICSIGLFSCTKMDGVAGAGSETTNSLTGTVASVDGAPVANAKVRLIPASYDPVKDQPIPDSLMSITNSNGRYTFVEVDSGAYNIFVQNQTGSTRALLCGVHVADTVSAPCATLKSFGAIRVNAPDDANKLVGYVYVPGTPLFAFLNNGGHSVIIDSVPPGVIPQIVYSSTISHSNSLLRSNIAVKSEDTTVAANPSWAHSMRLFLNTTSTGASIVNNVYDFPVLVRLNQSTFDFSQAKAGGADLRFTTPDNRQLSYEIERWDSVSKEAEIWVRVDTVRANNNRQFIVMYWGNTAASGVSSSSATFDTSRGFQGVWHLSGDGNETAYDATANGYNGTPYNMTKTSAVKGAVGMARSFNGSSTYIRMQNTATGKLNFPEDGVFSMSLWVYADTVDSTLHAIAGKGHEQYYMQFKCLKQNTVTMEFADFLDQKGWQYTDDTLRSSSAKQWFYLTGVRSGTKQWFYVNGDKVDEVISTMPGTSYDRNTTDDFAIGSFGRSVTIPYAQGWSYFRGKIDEVRMSSVAPNDDWVKLCYMNQKAVDALVVFEK